MKIVKVKNYMTDKIIEKNYFIAFLNEKNYLLKYLHYLSVHRGMHTLYNLIIKQNFIWNGMFTDIKNYINSCIICQQTKKITTKKPIIKQIISAFPKERYVTDLVLIDKTIDDDNHQYKYILNIIDHFSKYTGCYLLENKTSKEVLYAINDFISKNGNPCILQCDNGREFSNKLLKKYCNDNNIQIIHSSPRHPSTNGVVERVHQNILKALKSLKLEQKDKYDIRFCIVLAEKAQNECIHNVTKLIPKDLFKNNNEEINNYAKANIIKSQKTINKNNENLKINTYVLISNIFNKKGNKLTKKFNKIGKKTIPGIIIENNHNDCYKVKILLTSNDLKFNEQYLIEYNLLKKTSKEICDKIISNKENLQKIKKENNIINYKTTNKINSDLKRILKKNNFKFENKLLNLNIKNNFSKSKISCTEKLIKSFENINITHDQRLPSIDLDNINNNKGLSTKEFSLNNSNNDINFVKDNSDNSDLNKSEFKNNVKYLDNNDDISDISISNDDFLNKDELDNEEKNLYQMLK